MSRLRTFHPGHLSPLIPPVPCLWRRHTDQGITLISVSPVSSGPLGGIHPALPVFHTEIFMFPLTTAVVRETQGPLSQTVPFLLVVYGVRSLFFLELPTLPRKGKANKQTTEIILTDSDTKKGRS